MLLLSLVPCVQQQLVKQGLKKFILVVMMKQKVLLKMESEFFLITAILNLKYMVALKKKNVL